MTPCNKPIAQSQAAPLKKPTWIKRYQHILFPVAGFAIALLAIYVLHDLLQNTSRAETLAAFHGISWSTVGLAVFFTALSYAAVALYDVVAVDTIAPNQISRRVAGLAGAASYAISNALGFSLLTGGALRYRIYAAKGISLADIGKIVGTSWFAIWFALIIMAGIALLIDPQRVPWISSLDPRIDIADGIIILCGIGWLIYWLSSGERHLKIGAMSLPLPNSRGAVIQICAGLVDVGAAAATLYVLMPQNAVPSFAVFSLVFVIALVLGIVSHAPGGLGAFEATLIAGLGISDNPTAIAGLLAYRVIYTLMPLFVATGGVVIWEIMRRRHKLGKQATFAKRLVEPLVPGLAASTIFVGGILLLISGATPDLRYRVQILSSIVPEFLVEASHLLASLAGATLLIVARGLFKRLERAWVAAITLLLCGAIFSLVKGLDWEEAMLLCLLAAALWSTRSSFYRRPISIPFILSWNWIATVATTVVVSTWLGFYVYRHVAYSNNLWLDFAWTANAPRFMRSTVLIFAMLFMVGVYSIINRHSQLRSKADYSIPDAIPRLVANCPHTDAALALLGDKRFLLAPQKDAFLMYAQSGGSLISLGEPIGNSESGRELAWTFHGLADRLALRTVFYGVGPQSLPLFLDMGLSALKLGEVARVNLANFSLDGPSRQPFRYADRKVDKDGLTFEIIPAARVSALMPRLREISDAWLAFKSGSEKRFSLGYFDETYLKRFDLAVLKLEGEVVAFANIWRGADKYEITVDLMRYMPNVHKLLMDALFAKLLMSSKEEGYQWFNLGAAPLAGLSGSRLASRWNRFGSFIYRSGAELYHFDGLKAFKEKFDPIWTPHYMVCPGGLETPRVLFDTATLINGSPLEFIRK